MAQNPIQWFPGHMAKTRRVIKECLPQVDVVIELLDARIPYSSRNPEIEAMIEQKPHITLLTKATLADPEVSRKWVEYYNARGSKTVLIDSITGYGLDTLDAAIVSGILDCCEHLNKVYRLGQCHRCGVEGSQG